MKSTLEKPPGLFQASSFRAILPEQISQVVEGMLIRRPQFDGFSVKVFSARRPPSVCVQFGDVVINLTTIGLT